MAAPDELNALMQPGDSPMKLDDYLNADIPQLGLHIKSFTDTTLVTVHWPHTMCDIMGIRSVLEVALRKAVVADFHAYSAAQRPRNP